ncbi:MAG: SpoIID/LytB domain-containing protein [Bdellovibrionales bacterium]
MIRTTVFTTALLSCSFVGTLTCADEVSILPESPLQSAIRAPSEPIELLPAGTTNQIAKDFARISPRLLDAPDRSYRTLWLRVFPLINVPLGDPFPQTKDVNIIDIQNDGGLNVFHLQTGHLLGNAKSLHLDFTKSTFMIGANAVPLSVLWIVPVGTHNTTLNWDKGSKEEVGMRVRGGIALEPTLYTLDSDGNTIPNPVPQWSIINVLEVEKYLLSVVPSEVLSSWHPSMLQAQAVAARTYTLYQMALARGKASNWDMDPTTWYQSYRGDQFLVNGKYQTVETASTTRATIATAGQAITYNGEVIDAYFSGNSGGTTCTASECFGQPDVPYLKQFPDAAGVTAKAGGTWGSKATITPASIATVMTTLGLTPASPPVRLEALRKGPSGRTWQLRVILQTGSLDLDPIQTRKMMHLFGAVRSFLYTLGKVTSGKQSIVGHGYGHGVGLSQEGGQIFALQGWNAAKILTYFYPNTKIVVL